MGERFKDEYGRTVQAGDWISFCYGLPPVHVAAEVINRDGELVVLTPGHNPEESMMADLKEHVYSFVILKGKPE